MFKDTVRNDDKKRVLELVHEGFLHDNRVPVILISTWQLNRSLVPHWVTVCAIDDQFVYLHDP